MSKTPDKVDRFEPVLEAGRWAIIKRGPSHFIAQMDDTRAIVTLALFPPELALALRVLKNRRTPRTPKPERKQKR